MERNFLFLKVCVLVKISDQKLSFIWKTKKRHIFAPVKTNNLKLI
jgi:hypothetical protein